MKPAFEPVVLARKKSGVYTSAINNSIEDITSLLEILWQTVKRVEMSLLKQEITEGIAAANASSTTRTNTAAIELSHTELLENTSPSLAAGSTYLNIVSLWNNILAENFQNGSMSTTEMETNITTALTTLKSYLLETTRKNITQDQTSLIELQLHAQTVAAKLQSDLLNLKGILAGSTVQDRAMSQIATTSHNEPSKHEPVVMARKPIPKGSSIAKNCQQYGTGAINVDACRIVLDVDDLAIVSNSQERLSSDETKYEFGVSGNSESFESGRCSPSDKGRFPSNVIGAVSGYEKYFYQAKVSRKERHCGFEAPEAEPFNNPEEMKKHPLWDPSIGTNSHRLMTKIREVNKQGNNHPTVKPVALMDYLIKLVTPPSTPDCQRKVLDPFMGSGSTGMAAVALGHHFTGCELDPNYVAIAEKRITAWNTPEEPEIENNFDELFEIKKAA
jgi:hypothetical protein